MKSNRLIKILIALLGITLLFATAAPVAHAQSVITGKDIVIKAGEVYDDDLYVGCDSFELDGAVKGDLVVFASQIKIGPNAVIEGDFIAGAQSILVQGKALDDVRLVAYAITLGKTAQFADDLTAAAYSLEAKSGSIIKGGMFYAGAQAVLDGEVSGTLRAAVSALAINGVMQKDVYLEMGSSDGNEPDFNMHQFYSKMPVTPNVRRGLEVGPQAKIAGNIEYTSSREYAIPAGVIAGKVTHNEPAVSAESATKPQTTPSNVFPNWFLSNLRNLVSLLLVGLLLTWLTPGVLRKCADILQGKPLPSLGWGALSFFIFLFFTILLSSVVIILAIVFGAITLGNLVGPILSVGFLGVSGLITAFSIAVSFVSKIVVSYLCGYLLLAKIKPEWAEQRFWPIITGVILFAILAAIPVLGWIITMVAILFGMGALWLFGASALSKPAAVAL